MSKQAIDTQKESKNETYDFSEKCNVIPATWSGLELIWSHEYLNKVKMWINKQLILKKNWKTKLLRPFWKIV